MLKAAVIGVGSMGKNHARVYYDLDNVELVAVADPNEKEAKKVAEKYGCHFYTDYNEMIDKEKIDLISIVVPTSLHSKVAVDCFNKKINCLVEKPIANTIENARRIIDAAKKNGKKLMIGHIERFNPAIIELKKRIDNGELGKVFKVDVNRVGPFPARVRDVGVVIDLAVHDLDIMRYLIGSEVERISAEIEKRVNTEHEDLLQGLLRFKNGTICSLNINWLTPTKIRKLYITGEKGMFVVNYLKQDLYFYENSELKNGIDYADIMRGVSEGTMMRFFINKKEPLKAEIEHFVDCVENNKQVLITGEDGLKVLQLAIKIIESSNKGASIS